MSGFDKVFPQTIPNRINRPISSDNPIDRGLTKREYFALHIAAAMYSNSANGFVGNIPRDAMNQADALLSALGS